MSLHRAVETIKKVGIGAGIGLVLLVVFTMLFRLGGFILKSLNPPAITPPNEALGDLPPLVFPESVVDNKFSYVLNTVSGTLPVNFPDRLIVYPLKPGEPSLLNLDQARAKARTLGFTDRQGAVLPERSLGNGRYEWSDPTGINRRLVFDIVTFNFTFSSQYKQSLTTLGAKRLGDQQNAIKTVEDFLGTITLLPEDIDLEKTKSINEGDSYNTYPKLFDIINGSLIPTASLSNAKVIRVDLFQKDIKYDLDTGVQDAKPLNLTLPIRYPQPPFSTMSFWIASGEIEPEIGEADFKHFQIDTETDTPATYPIITAEEAFEALKNGKAYIAAYHGIDQQILIDKVYLAYYLGAEEQKYLMPIIVFEGQNGFFAYLSAVAH
jgi:hypothetical protein